MKTAQATSPVRQSQVSEAICELTAQCEHLDKSISLLTERLANVTTSEPPTAPAKDSAVCPSRVPVAENIWARVTGLNDSIERIESLTGRLEV